MISQIRDILIVGVILSVIIISHNCVQKELEKSSNELVAELKNFKEQVKISDKSDDSIKNKANEIYNKWKDTTELWSVIIEHQEIDSIEKAMVGIKSRYRDGRNTRSHTKDRRINISCITHAG